MHLIIDQSRPEPPTLDSAISVREGVLYSIIVHLLLIVAILVVPKLPFVQAWAEDAREARARAAEVLERQVQDTPRWVFIEPRLPEPVPEPPPEAMLSDRDAEARAPERAESPSNPLPFSQGNTPDLVDDGGAEARARGLEDGARERPSEEPPQQARNEPSEAESLLLPDAEQRPPAPERSASPPAVDPSASASPGDLLGRALDNIERYLPEEKFDNPGGTGGQFGQDFDFDRKGVEFGPWIRFFRAQVRSNWLVPEAAQVMKGHVVITLHVWKDGRISDVAVVRPSGIDAFDRAAVNALRWSNPTRPLPAEYPEDHVFFTVTFYYNEWPASP